MNTALIDPVFTILLYYRQTLAEFNPDMTIYLVRLDGMVQVTNLNILLPGAFSPKRLKFEFHNGNAKVEK